MTRRSADSIAFNVLELLASEAPAAQLAELVEQARRSCESAPEREAICRIEQLGLSIRSRSQQRRRREAGLAALADTARDLALPYELDNLLRVITRRARLLLGADVSCLTTSEPAGGDSAPGPVRIRTTDGPSGSLRVGLAVPDGFGLGGGVPADPGPFWTPDFLVDERIRRSPAVDGAIRAEGLRAVMAVPLGHRARPFGTLYVAERAVRYFTTDEISLMAALGDLAGVAIEKARLLERAARTPPAAAPAGAPDPAGELAEAHRALVDLALSGRDPHALVRDAGRRLDLGLRVYASDGTVLASTGELPELDGPTVVATAVDTHAAGRPVRLAGPLWAAPVRAGSTDLGTLLARPTGRRADLAAEFCQSIAQAVAVALLLEGQRSAAPVRHVGDELLDELLSSPQRPPRQLDVRARRLGIDLSAAHVLVVARPEGEAQGRTATWAGLYAHRMSGLKRVHNGRAVLLLPGSDPGRAARAVAEELTPLLGLPVTVGAAGPVSDPTSVFHGYQEALRCLDAMTSLGAVGRAASARELGFVGVLLADNHDVEGFIESAVGPVLDYDRQRLTELTRTLQAWFDTGNSPTHAAQRLHVHPNTVARRLERIGELLGPDWLKPERSFEIQLALRLSRVRRTLLDRVARADPGRPGDAADGPTGGAAGDRSGGPTGSPTDRPDRTDRTGPAN
ncbi:helix-turn-helix domain-containing protein [Kitasatospora purpeofusca]|uniref:helix-turn-helix domain-containing protein n=1 Tax=Kitasatospora purpeofusca TaxID=67352 RepID=UPI002253B4A5|nr:helix-turn-helix domain-containing protein [Kitasatospora purpeofusca]MCX4686565.1 helix-turn-helix domain-containing protein [Kitasatospora purpeofusca]